MIQKATKTDSCLKFGSKMHPITKPCMVELSTPKLALSTSHAVYHKMKYLDECASDHVMCSLNDFRFQFSLSILFSMCMSIQHCTKVPSPNNLYICTASQTTEPHAYFEFCSMQFSFSLVQICWMNTSMFFYLDFISSLFFLFIFLFDQDVYNLYATGKV